MFLVESHRGAIEFLRIIPVFLLQFHQLRLKSLHLLHRFMCFACEGVRNNFHQSSQEDNRDAVVSNDTVKSFKYPEHSPCEGPEESEVDDFREAHWVFRCIRCLYTFQDCIVLRTNVEPKNMRFLFLWREIKTRYDECGGLCWCGDSNIGCNICLWCLYKFIGSGQLLIRNHQCAEVLAVHASPEDRG